MRKAALADAQLGLGRVLAELNRTGEAEACFRQALVLNPSLLRPNNELGGAARQIGVYTSYRPDSDAVDPVAFADVSMTDVSVEQWEPTNDHAAIEQDVAYDDGADSAMSFDV